MADQIRLIRETGLFDEVWYESRYPDVLLSGLASAEHFIRIGQYLGRQPNENATPGDGPTFLTACRNFDEGGNAISAELRSQLARYRLFDPIWYRDHFAREMPESTDLLVDYLGRSASDPTIDPGPLFSTAGYAQMHPDTASVAPLVHAGENGIAEGRRVFDAAKVDEFLSAAAGQELSQISDLLDRSKPVRVVYWQDGNFFFTEIAQYLRSYLEAMGYSATCANDLPDNGVDGAEVVVVAPHEFCVYGPGKHWDSQLLRQAVYLNTEQWHTSWFSLSYRYLTLSQKGLDMNPASAAGLQRLGVDTAFLPLLPMPGSPFEVGRLDVSEAFAKTRYIKPLVYPDTLMDRAYDVLFVGAANARREAALGKLAPVLADHEAFIHCPRFNGPVRQGDPDMMSTSDIVQLARNSKILLNIHQGESRYFEWHRLFLFGVMEGCIVLTEPCIPNAFVQAGRHFLECPGPEMPERLRWLLETDGGREELLRIRTNCDRLRRDNTDWKNWAR